MYPWPDEVVFNSAYFFLVHDSPFIQPFGLFPALELDEDLVGIHGLVEVEENLSLDGISSKVEWFVDLDEYLCHVTKSFIAIYLITVEKQCFIILYFLIIPNNSNNKITKYRLILGMKMQKIKVPLQYF